MDKIQASATNLSLWYDTKQALFDINLSIKRREVVALIGPSGCGKSTFLRCFNRMNDYIHRCRVSGELYIDGMNVYDPDMDPVLLRAKVGMVFQRPNPFPKSVYDNVAYGPKIHGMASRKHRLDDIVEKSLMKVGLWDELNGRLKDSALELSGGQQQRLCIARAIAIKPTMLLMDEPCSALDPVSTSIIENLILELREKFAVILVTHSMKQARKVSDSIAFFHSGKLIEYNSTAELFAAPKEALTKQYIAEHI